MQVGGGTNNFFEETQTVASTNTFNLGFTPNLVTVVYTDTETHFLQRCAKYVDGVFTGNTAYGSGNYCSASTNVSQLSFSNGTLSVTTASSLNFSGKSMKVIAS